MAFKWNSETRIEKLQDENERLRAVEADLKADTILAGIEIARLRDEMRGHIANQNDIIAGLRAENERLKAEMYEYVRDVQVSNKGKGNQ